MKGLNGDLSTMPLADLVVYLGNRRASGTLTLDQAHTHKEVVLQGGAVRGASSNLPREYLGQFLINVGQITEDQFHKAYETQRETEVPLGRILVMIGLVTADSLQHALALKFRETLLSAYDWTAGHFAFDPTRMSIPAEAVELSVDLFDIHREGALRETAWRAIRGTFPRGDVPLEIFSENLPEVPRPGSFDERLIALAREGLTIEELALALHATDFLLYHRLFALLRLDAVRILPPRPAGAGTGLKLGAEPPSGEIISFARRYLEAGQLREAEALARRAYEQAGSPETSELLKDVEARLLAHLRQQLMEPGHAPRLLISPAQVKSTEMSAPERYLLSRVDGTRPLRAIVQVSPLRELDALKYFQEFIERKLVAVP
jgi:hypothetical protein